MEPLLTEQFVAARKELTAYVCRLVIRPQLAEDLVQSTYLRCLEAKDRLPTSVDGIRGWLFKVASNLAFDELRRHGHWREHMLTDLRDAAIADRAFVQQSLAMAETPETKAIAREHVVACVACTMRNLPEQKAAALLLVEVHGFSVDEAADLLEATVGQTKNWLQEGRAHMLRRYDATCALISKTGVCHQCEELDEFMRAHQGRPLPDGATLDHRLALVRTHREVPWSGWHRIMLERIPSV
ncbi:MAG: RNA polymerase sigma factor [Burkholderiales bacterium]|nr:RNA polymerase sigma factor [Burkholderiales bacterium]